MKLYTNGCSFTQGHHPFETDRHTQVFKDIENYLEPQSALFEALKSLIDFT